MKRFGKGKEIKRVAFPSGSGFVNYPCGHQFEDDGNMPERCPCCQPYRGPMRNKKFKAASVSLGGKQLSPTSWKLVIENWHPMTTNQYNSILSRGRPGRFMAAKMVRKQADTIRAAALFAGCPDAKTKRSVRLTITRVSGRTPDRDAYDKKLLDTLKTAGMLVDDNQHWLKGKPTTQFKTGKSMRTEIVLTELTNEILLKFAEEHAEEMFNISSQAAKSPMPCEEKWRSTFKLRGASDESLSPKSTTVLR